MAYRHFPGKTEAWLEAALSTLADQEASGRITTTAGEGTIQYSKLVVEGIATRKRKILHDLNILNPTDYPIDDVSLPTRTVSRFGTLTL